MLAELDEEYARFVVPAKGRRAAGWYWRQVLASIPAAGAMWVRQSVLNTERLWMDLRQGWRAWRRVPGVAMALIVLPALGIGGVAALFGPLYSLVLAPLPFPHPDELVRLGGGIPLFNGYTTTFNERERLTPIFSNVMAYAAGSGPVRLTSAGRTLSVNVEGVTSEFFETLAVSPQRGRGLVHEAAGRACGCRERSRVGGRVRTGGERDRKDDRARPRPSVAHRRRRHAERL